CRFSGNAVRVLVEEAGELSYAGRWIAAATIRRRPAQGICRVQSDLRMLMGWSSTASPQLGPVALGPFFSSPQRQAVTVRTSACESRNGERGTEEGEEMEGSHAACCCRSSGSCRGKQGGLRPGYRRRFQVVSQRPS